MLSPSAILPNLIGSSQGYSCFAFIFESLGIPTVSPNSQNYVTFPHLLRLIIMELFDLLGIICL
jgi:hypothetical protein